MARERQTDCRPCVTRTIRGKRPRGLVDSPPERSTANDSPPRRNEYSSAPPPSPVCPPVRSYQDFRVAHSAPSSSGASRGRCRTLRLCTSISPPKATPVLSTKAAPVPRDRSIPVSEREKILGREEAMGGWGWVKSGETEREGERRRETEREESVVAMAKLRASIKDRSRRDPKGKGRGPRGMPIRTAPARGHTRGRSPVTRPQARTGQGYPLDHPGGAAIRHLTSPVRLHLFPNLHFPPLPPPSTLRRPRFDLRSLSVHTNLGRLDTPVHLPPRRHSSAAHVSLARLL